MKWLMGGGDERGGGRYIGGNAQSRAGRLNLGRRVETCFTSFCSVVSDTDSSCRAATIAHAQHHRTHTDDVSC